MTEPSAATIRPAPGAAERPAIATDRAELPPLRPLPAFLDDAAHRYPDRRAIDFMGRGWSYGEFARLVDRATRGLQDQGVVPGTRVGLCLPNTPYFCILYFAALKAGATVVSINPLYSERELHHLLLDAEASLVAVPDLTAIHGKLVRAAAGTGVRRLIVCPFADVLPLAKRLGFRLLKRREIARVPDDGLHMSFANLIANAAAPDPVPVSPNDVAVLQYTGGTTGVPKGAMLTHANLAANAEQEVIHVGGEPGEAQRVLGVLPLFHVFALTCVLNFAVRIAAEMVLLPRYETKSLLAAIARTRPSYLPAVPTIYGALAREAETHRLDLSSIRFCISGGAPLPQEVAERFVRATGAKLVEGYGLSETAPIITCNPMVGGTPKPGSAGRPFPATTIEIRDLEDSRRLVAIGERGEICARGSQVMAGYWRRPDDTADVMVDGALRTGDVGYLDEDGFLFIVDRIKDVILCGGYNVYPRIIEDALYEHPAIAEAVVVGLPDAYRGQAPKAFVTLQPGAVASEASLCTFLAERLSKIELPREIEVREALPKTLIGKLSKKALVEEALAGKAAA